MERSKGELAQLKEDCRDLFFFCTVVLADAYPDKFHDWGKIQKRMCDYLTDGKSMQKFLSAFRLSFKTTVLLGFIVWGFVWAIEDGIAYSMLYNTGTKENAWNLNADIRHILMNCPLLHKMFPKLPTAKDAYTEWSKNRVQIKHWRIDFASLETTLVSRHYPQWINDDLENDDNSRSEYMRAEVIRKWKYQKAILMKLKKKNMGLEIEVGTPYHFQGLNWTVRNMPHYDKLIIPSEDEFGDPTFPELYSKEDLDHKKMEMGWGLYSAQFLLRPLADEDALCPEEWLTFWHRLPENRWRTMVIDAGGSEPKTTDATGITIVDTDEFGSLHVIYAEELWLTPVNMMKEILSLMKQYNPDDTRIEKEKYALTVADLFQHEFPRYNIGFVEHKGRKKENRIWRLRQWLEKRRILISENQKALKSQLLQYPAVNHDDLLDSLSYHLDILRVPKPNAPPKWIPNIEKSFDQEFSEFMMKQRARKGEDVYDTLY